jgi:hypothetical protein
MILSKLFFSMGDDKAPGPDGYTSAFFKKSWSIVGGEFCSAIQEFFSSGEMLKQINHSIIDILPKSTHASSRLQTHFLL